MRSFICELLSLLIVCGASAAPKPVVADNYLDLTVTYCIYAKTIWHDADVGGYWGDGLAPAADKNANGHVRGMVNTMLGYAILVHAVDEKWLSDPLASQLQQAGLTRDELLKYIKLNLQFLNAHHSSKPDALKPNWGFTWQSTLWIGGAGPAAILVWKDLPNDIKTDFKRVVTTEADRIVSKPPKDYKPGDTGAEENAWDTHGPAVALALDPQNPHAVDWMKALKSYAVNVYSTPAEKGTDGVTTANIFADYTLENHGFFHPDYIQVCGQHLGEALLYLQMGDKLNGTKLADEFKPQALHNLAAVWERVMRHLVLPDGDFAFPNGTDWTLRSSMTPSYLACIATLLGDPEAAKAEIQHPQYALRHRAVSPPGRILGDTNLEWWWEPLLIKRSATALLQHEYRDGASAAPKVDAAPSAPVIWKDAKAFAYRTKDYFVTVSWGAKHMGTFAANDAKDPITLPIEGIIPKEMELMVSQKTLGDAQVVALKSKSNHAFFLVCLPHSVFWFSSTDLRGLGIQNDKLSGGKRHLFSESIDQDAPMLGDANLEISASWANIDDRLGLIANVPGFQYSSPKTFNRKSAAFDTISPTSNVAGWHMLAGVTHEQTKKLAAEMSAGIDGEIGVVHLRDGPDGKLYTIEAEFNASTISVETK